ncbi:hypothetical protein [Mangrovactinospora gilvigrisea]|nr:hypothetical protein [Mangrovactinospora gilvigrisea]
MGGGRMVDTGRADAICMGGSHDGDRIKVGNEPVPYLPSISSLGL